MRTGYVQAHDSHQHIHYKESATPKHTRRRSVTYMSTYARTLNRLKRPCRPKHEINRHWLAQANMFPLQRILQ